MGISIHILFNFVSAILNFEILRTDGSPPFLHKPILHSPGPTQLIQHTIVRSRAYYSTSVVETGGVESGTCGIGL